MFPVITFLFFTVSGLGYLSYREYKKRYEKWIKTIEQKEQQKLNLWFKINHQFSNIEKNPSINYNNLPNEFQKGEGKIEISLNVNDYLQPFYKISRTGDLSKYGILNSKFIFSEKIEQLIIYQKKNSQKIFSQKKRELYTGENMIIEEIKHLYKFLMFRQIFDESLKRFLENYKKSIGELKYIVRNMIIKSRMEKKEILYKEDFPVILDDVENCLTKVIDYVIILSENVKCGNYFKELNNLCLKLLKLNLKYVLLPGNLYQFQLNNENFVESYILNQDKFVGDKYGQLVLSILSNANLLDESFGVDPIFLTNKVKEGIRLISPNIRSILIPQSEIINKQTENVNSIDLVDVIYISMKVHSCHIIKLFEMYQILNNLQQRCYNNEFFSMIFLGEKGQFNKLHSSFQMSNDVTNKNIQKLKNSFAQFLSYTEKDMSNSLKNYAGSFFLKGFVKLYNFVMFLPTLVVEKKRVMIDYENNLKNTIDLTKNKLDTQNNLCDEMNETSNKMMEILSNLIEVIKIFETSGILEKWLKEHKETEKKLNEHHEFYASVNNKKRKRDTGNEDKNSNKKGKFK